MAGKGEVRSLSAKESSTYVRTVSVNTKACLMLLASQMSVPVVRPSRLG